MLRGYKGYFRIGSHSVIGRHGTSDKKFVPCWGDPRVEREEIGRSILVSESKYSSEQHPIHFLYYNR